MPARPSTAPHRSVHLLYGLFTAVLAGGALALAAFGPTITIRVLALLGGAALAAIAGDTLTPHRFTLSPDGLQYRASFRRRTWPWHQIAGARAYEGRLLGIPVRAVELELANGARVLLHESRTVPGQPDRPCPVRTTVAVINSAIHDPAYRAALRHN